MMLPIQTLITSIFMIFYILSCSNSSFAASFLAKNTVWEGTVRLSEDILVPKGITLRVRKGTTVIVSRAQGSRTDPEFISPVNEIMVRGVLLVEGDKENPVKFIPEENGSDVWGGIIIESSGKASISNAIISGAESALNLYGGKAKLTDSEFYGNNTALTATGEKSSVIVERCSIHDNDYGIIKISHPSIKEVETVIKSIRKKETRDISLDYEIEVENRQNFHSLSNKLYRNRVLAGETVWSGNIRVEGEIRVPEGSILMIAPGTVVEFSKIDSDGNGIGESSLMIQGRIIAKGTKNSPITFTSAEKEPSVGDWDGINIMNSDRGENIFEFCRFNYGYRPLHFHFSNVFVADSVIYENMRGVQFQESIVTFERNLFSRNSSALQGRDSDIVFRNNLIRGNIVGFNFLRSTVKMEENRLTGNSREGGRLRECISLVTGNSFTGNRGGVLLLDLYMGDFSGNYFIANSDSGLSMKNVNNLKISGNYFAKNGINGISLQKSSAEIRGNIIASNIERGVGISSFSGRINGNSIVDNKLYDIENEGSEDVDATGNWWGYSTASGKIMDAVLDNNRGAVNINPPLSKPQTFDWNLADISTEAVFTGAIRVQNTPQITKTGTLNVLPGTEVIFSKNAGLKVYGKLISKGTDRFPILYRGEKSEPGYWDEILLEHANGSIATFSSLKNANWGIHSHFTDLNVTESTFEGNFGGIRFRSGPIVISHSKFIDNSIGIRSYIGNGTISDSLITNNDIGLFVREGAASLKVKRNIFSSNREYAVRMGDFNKGDLDASQNRWGVRDADEIIFDEKDEAGIGRVRWEPPLTDNQHLQ